MNTQLRRPVIRTFLIAGLLAALAAMLTGCCWGYGSCGGGGWHGGGGGWHGGGHCH